MPNNFLNSNEILIEKNSWKNHSNGLLNIIFCVIWFLSSLNYETRFFKPSSHLRDHHTACATISNQAGWSSLCNIFCFMNCAGKIVSTLVDLKLFEDYITSSFFSFNNQAMAVWLFDWTFLNHLRISSSFILQQNRIRKSLSCSVFYFLTSPMFLETFLGLKYCYFFHFFCTSNPLNGITDLQKINQKTDL